MKKLFKSIYLKLRIKYLVHKYFGKVRLNVVEQICPKCGKVYNEYPALSRRDNKTEICPQCGVDEAIEDFKKAMEVSKNNER